jgi:hypothetical protein
MRGTRNAGWVCFLGLAILALGVERAEAQSTGACCDYLAEVCTDGVTESTCESSDRQYRGHGTTCDNLAYPCGCDTECSECSVKQGAGSRHVEINLISVTSSGGNTTFTYEICRAPTSQQLSHWVMGLSTECCDRIVSASGGTEVGTSCDTDPTTGLYGLKWETENGVPVCNGSTCNGGGDLFSITLSGSVPTGCVKTVNKINGPPSNAWGCVQGPVCQDCVEHADCDDGNVCNGVELCVGGECELGAPLDCDDGNLCTDDTCDPEDGCQNTPKNCNDGVACTVDTCDPDTGACVNTPDDSICDDGLFCNGAETCHPTLGCQAGTPPDCDDGVACTEDSCDEATAQCVNTPNDSFCDDGKYCTGIETCDPNLGCQAGTPPNCDDGVACTNDKCDELTESCINTPSNALCDDGNPCNGLETCDPTLGCQAGTPPACNDGLACTIDTCDPDTGQCVHTPDDSVCDDGLFCNGEETCSALHGCVAGDPVECDDGVACTSDACDEDQDQCVHTPMDGACSDGNPCTINTCDPINGCQTAPVVCDDGIPCTTDTCDSQTGQCVYTPDDSLCDDGVFCNGAETCDPNLGCQAGAPVNCVDGVACTSDSCDEATESCINAPDNGACDDGVACTVDVCDPVNGCSNTPDDSLCDDGDPCTINTCDPVNGCETAPVVCDDGVACTTDTCDSQTGQCVYTPDDSLCDDGLYCNGTETCDPNLGCQAGAPINCDDGVGCTADSCDEATDSCINAPDDSLCDDGLFCNGIETCDPTLDCQAGTPVDCNDGVACTNDSCDEATDSCVNAPDNGACDDGVACTVDICDPVTGCSNAPDDSLCDDGNPCTINTCDPLGGCQTTPVVCDDGIACTTDTCDPQTGLCVYTPDDSLCDDGQFCNGNETCDPNLGCMAGAPIDCDDGVDCTDDFCDEVNDTCVHTPLDAACDDGVACTVDSCDPVNGCVHTPDDSLCSNGLYCDGQEFCDPLLNCQDGPDPCTAPLKCDEALDVCVDCLSDGQCDDGLWCNGTETCVGGVCQPGTPVDCNDGVSCTVDTCDEATQSCINTTDDSVCNDGLFCNGVETCDPTNDCQAGTPVDCDDLNDCTIDSCDEATASCVNTPDNGACDDGVACTVDVCDPIDGCVNTPDDGACDDGDPCTINTCDPVNGCETAPVVCDDGIACTNDFCDPNTGLCVYQPDDGFCDNGLWCDGAEVCDPDNGCQPGVAPDCDDNVDCTDDSCDEVNDTCVNTPNNANCDDALFCNGVETCDSVNDCQPGSNPCPKELLCDEDNDTCVECFLDEDCDDGAFCNGFEECVGGFCEPGPPPDCDDGIDCTNCFCDTQINFCRCEPDDSVCDDGLYCNGVESCDPDLGCQAGTPVNCDDGVACTIDTCDEGMQSCVNTPDDSLCDDSNPCTINTCDPINGCQSTPVVCDDGVPCTMDSCDPNTGLCVYQPDDGFCDNGLWCDGQETCDAVNGCQPGTPADCNDSIDCTIDTCDEANDKCVNQPKHSLCDDAIHCNGIETCDPQQGCVAGTPPACNDGIDCTNSYCDEDQAKCVHDPDDALCDDEVYCNGVEFCDPLFGCRAGTPVDCDDGIECTSDECDEATQSCISTPHNSVCSDGQYCNGQEICDPALGCQPGQPIVCDDGIACTIGSCDESLDMCRYTAQHLLCDDGDPCTQGVCQNGSGCTYTTTCGACCIFGGGCVDGVTESDCQLLGPSLFMGIGSTCTGSRGEIGDTCPDLIPTVSEWGLVILALLLLAGAKVSFGRRRVRAT